MANFEFQDDLTFHENTEAFLAHLDEVDEEMAAILRANLSLLQDIVVNGEKNLATRSKFNEGVLAALTQMLDTPEEHID